MEEPLLPILSQSPCTSHNFMLWTSRGDEIYWRRLQRLWAIMETPHASNTDIFARVMRLVWTWETQDFYLPQSVAHRDIFEAADSVPSSTVSAASPHSGAPAAAGERTPGSGAVSSCPDLDSQQRIRQWEAGTSAESHLAIMRAHGWASSRGTKRSRTSSD